MAGDVSSDSSSGPSASSSGSSMSVTASQSSSSSSSSSDASRSGSSHSERHKSEIRKADQIFGKNSSITGTMGYARLSSAGKSTVELTIRKLVNVIGRTGFDADCQIRSDSRLVSRRHACLFWDEEADQWAIECLSAKNGMLVDGTPLVVGAPPIHLRSKNLIEMGDAAFFFLEAAAPTFRTSDVTRTEALVLDVRASRKKKRIALSVSTSSYHQSRKRTRMSSIPTSSKRLALKGKTKHRSAAADVETDDSSDDEDVRSVDRQKEEENMGMRRTSKVALKVASKKSRKPSTGSASNTVAAEDDMSPTKGIDYPAPRPAATKRRLSLKKTAILTTPASKKRKTATAESPAHSVEVSGASGAQKYREEWNKKEKTDFGRALFAIGVDSIQDEDGNVTYDWTRFRGIAELARKSDEMLADYYRRMMHDVETLLEEEEREKRTKGPRTKHKPKCDCVVCENTRKSRRKKREENSNTGGDVLDSAAANASADEDDEAAVKSTGRTEDRLVGLVTAQKLRVRMSIHEAARQVDSEAGVAVIQKLSSQSHTSGANGELPSWWITGKHDRALMIGTAKHGVGQWQEIWNDDELEEFAALHEEEAEDVKWPTPQTAMKRLREVASSINAEIRRLNKKEARRAARAERGEDVSSAAKEGKPKSKGRGKGKGKGKGNATEKNAEKSLGKTKGKGKGRARGKTSAKTVPEIVTPKHRAVYASGEGGGSEAQTQSEGSESRGSTQEESDAENGFQGTRANVQVSNDVEVEDEDEVMVEVVEEEDEEVEVEEYEDSEQQQAQQVVDTDDDDGDEDEDKVEYETASESGSN